MQNCCSLKLLVVLVLLAASGALAGDFYATEANTRGCNRIACLSATGSSTPCGANPSSYFQASNATMQGFPFPAYTPRQFVAMPFRYSGDGTFEILRVRTYWKMVNVETVSLAVFLYKANATNPRVPGDIIPGTPSLGQLATFTRVTNQSNDLRQFWELVATLPTPVNVTAGLYYVTIAGFNSTGGTASYNYIAGWQNFTLNSDGEPYYTLAGFDGRWNAATSLYPYMAGSIPTFTWQPVDNAVSCLWPEGIRRETVVPPDYYVRYPLNTDLNDFVPADFVLSLTSSLNATLTDLTAANASYPYPPSVLGFNGTRIYVANASRASLALNGTASVDGTSVDFYVGGPYRAALSALTLNFDLDGLRAYGVPILSAPLQVDVTSA